MQVIGNINRTGSGIPALGLRVNVPTGNVSFTKVQIRQCMNRVEKLLSTDDVERGAAPTRAVLQVTYVCVHLTLPSAIVLVYMLALCIKCIISDDKSSSFDIAFVRHHLVEGIGVKMH